jgi:hypothetical protein
MPHQRKRSEGASCAPCRGKKTCEQAECAGSAISSGAWILALRLPACATLVTISTVQGVDKRLVFINSYGAVERGGDVNLGHTEQLEVSSFPKQMNEASEMRLQLTQLAEALAGLYRLREDYAPTWYTFDHHERVESALRSMKKF